jgi:hypothetical protein
VLRVLLMTAISERTRTYIAVLCRIHDVDPALGSAIRRACFGGRVTPEQASRLIEALRALPARQAVAS